MRTAGPLLLAAAIPGASHAQTANAGTPVVATHSGDEVHPALIRDGKGGAYVGFQVLNVIHVARLLQAATPDPAWAPSTADAIGGGPTTMIAAAGSHPVWAVSCTQSRGFAHLLQHLPPGGPPPPAGGRAPRPPLA